MSNASSQAESDNVRPVIATAAGGDWGLYAFLAILLVGGIGLFTALRSGHDESGIASTTLPSSAGERIASPAPLVVPQFLANPKEPEAPATPEANERLADRDTPVQQHQPQVIERFVPQPAPPRVVDDYGPRVIFDEPLGGTPTSPTPLQAQGDRVQASRLANPATTVPQGTVIPAVLETAFDSTRPGAVRALVQRDIYGFDGTRILIPRGSRLYGTYEAGLRQGERRALIRWTRLLRPDGVTIPLDSPASDPLGRAGVEGDVDSKFFARFGGAIVQSVLDIGVGFATRKATDGVVVALPGSTQNITASQSQQVQPVLEIDHGTSVSVFVARDLDFSSVEP